MGRRRAPRRDPRVGARRAVDWVGHSFGGRLVAELAARDPERVERAVLLDPALQVLPHVALDLAESERHDVSYASVEDAVQARYDAGRVLLAPRDRVIESDRAHLEPGRDGRLRYRYCEERGDRRVERDGEPTAAARPRADADGARRRLLADVRASTSTRTAPSSATFRGRHRPGRAHGVLGRARRDRARRSTGS